MNLRGSWGTTVTVMSELATPETEMLGALTWPQISDLPTLVIPLGSTEQHGPHLPFDTDTQIAEAVAIKAAAGVEGVVVAPALAYGASGEHAGFAGTLSLGTEVLGAVMIELARSARPSFGRVVFVNGHGGNHEAVTAAVEQLRAEGHNIAAWSPRIAGGDAHAGRTETSLLLAINASAVALDRCEPGNTSSLRELMPELVAGGVAAVAPNGVLGDPTGATAEEGQRILAGLVIDLREVLS